MKRTALFASAFVVFFAGLFSLANAGQDRTTYTQSSGPGEGGLVRSVRASGSAGSLTHWATVIGSGIYKSVDGGASWTPSGNGIDHKFVRQLRVHPTNPAILYVVTIGGAGFYKSTDGGATWSASNAGLNCRFVNNFAVVNGGANAGHLYAATSCTGSGGIYKSTDGGANWIRVGFPTIPGNIDVSTIQASSNGTHLRAGTNVGVYASFDSGANWEQRNTGLFGPRGPEAGDVNVITPVGNPGVPVWSTDITGNGVFWSENNGASWTQSTGLPAGAFAVGFVTIDADAWVFVDGAGPYKSTDGGKTWFAAPGFAGLPTLRTRNMLKDADGIWWASTLAGAYKSTDAGANWTRQSNGLPRGMVINAQSAPSTPQTIFAASDTIYKSTDGGSTWSASDNGITGMVQQSSGRFGGVAVDPNNPATIYAQTVTKGVFKSTDTGATWAPINNGIGITLIGNPANFRIAPSDSNVLWMTMGGRAFKSTNAGANWLDTNVPAGARSPAIDPSNPNIVYMATASGLYKTTDGGASWLFKNPGFLTFGVSRPQVMSGAPQNVLLAVTHVDNLDRANSVSGVYLSTDGADTWRQLVSNEKAVSAVFVNTPGGKVGAYIATLGYFDEPVGDERVFKCVDILGNSFELARNCKDVDVGPNPGFVRSFGARSNRLLSVATSSGLAKHRFLYLGPDFNNDGRADIFWRYSPTGANTIWHMNGTGFSNENAVEAVRTVGSPWIVAGFGDFDGNGTSDVLWRNTSSGENYVFFMDGATILSEGYIRSVPDQNWSVAGVGDFDGDGNSDILWRNAVSGDNYVYRMDGLQIVDEGYLRNVPTAWSVAGVGDFDGDFKADVLWRNGSTGQNYLYPMEGLAIKPSEGYLRPVPTAWSVKALGDFNLDNKMDIVWRNSSSGENYVYPMDGTAVLPSEGYLPTVSEAGWDVAAVGDFDANGTTIRGRGHSDILWRNSASGAAYLWKMSDPTVIATQCGAMGCQSGFLPLVGDTNWQIMNR